MLIIRAAVDTDLSGVLALQARVHRDNVDELTASTEGFVSWRHDLETLRRFNSPVPHTVAVDRGNIVQAYALSMDLAHANAMPEARSLIEKLAEQRYRGRVITDYDYVCMGQVAIARPFRGRGVFTRLYAAWQARQAAVYELAVTEIALANGRSRAAHAREGWVTVGANVDASGVDWIIVAKPLR